MMMMRGSGSTTQASHQSVLTTHYELLMEVIGGGGSTVVRKCINRSTGVAFACKSISKKQQRQKNFMERVRKEVNIMVCLSGHPNLVELEDVYEDKEYVHLVMQLCQGGDLYHKLENRQPFTERKAAQLIKSLVEVVSYCHRKGVLHRDIKLENILFANTREDSPIKLADFGLATYFDPAAPPCPSSSNFASSNIVGTPHYLAPEVFKGLYSQQVDVWSAGIILYVLLCGYFPFSYTGQTPAAILRQIKACNLNLCFKEDSWHRISTSAKHLIARMLCVDPKARITPAQVLRHPWILMNHAQTPLHQASQDRVTNIPPAFSLSTSDHSHIINKV